MTLFQPIGSAADRVMASLKAGLSIEFGSVAGDALAQRFLAAERPEFHWDARIEERWIGRYEATGDDDYDLDRVAIFGQLDGAWFAAVCIVDGNGMAHGMTGHRHAVDRWEAIEIFGRFH